ncbi:MAG: hypothetical protein Q8L95_10715 [Burkholderiales bacterium]|nr:hypothetical protein [Burkholderiales bacterium]
MTVSRLLGRSLRSITLRWALAAMLLLAQQGALTHALTHAAGHAHESVAALHDPAHELPAQVDHDESGGGSAVSGQCAFDLVYSQMLGGVHTGHTLHFAATGPLAHTVVVAHSRGTTTSVPYDSRGPPALS